MVTGLIIDSPINTCIDCRTSAPHNDARSKSQRQTTTTVNGTDYELDHVKALLAKGWAVAVTDYEGLGTPGTHTYIVADAEAHAVLDIVRAATQVPELGLSPSAPVGIVGYSQGGQAAARAAEIESTYAPELDVVGVVAGGVPSDPEQLGTTLDGGLFFARVAAQAPSAARPPPPSLETGGTARPGVGDRAARGAHPATRRSPADRQPARPMRGNRDIGSAPPRP